MELEYVSSGNSMWKVHSADPIDVRKILHELNSIKNSKYSFLYNAYTEKSLGEAIYKSYKSDAFNIHSDSGGLQIMLLGLPNTPQLRNEVYNHQKENSHVAMGFDIIPVIQDANASNVTNRLGFTSKVLETGKMYDAGMETGQNIKDQIAVMNSNVNVNDTKPQMIIHGNAFKDYENYYDGMTKILTSEDLKQVRGCAVSGAAIGGGTLQMCDMTNAMLSLDTPEHIKKNIHLLGVGSVSKLLPVIMMMKSGRISEDTHISYDSSSHSGSFMFGNLLDPQTESGFAVTRGNTISINRASRIIYDTFPAIIDDIFGNFNEFNKEYITQINNEKTPGKRIIEDYVDSAEIEHIKRKIYSVAMLHVNAHQHIFMNMLQRAIEDPVKYALKYRQQALLSLGDVTSQTQYEHWRNTAGQHIKSMPLVRDVDVIKRHNISQFFG